MLARLVLILVVALSPVLAMAAKPGTGCRRAGAARLSSPKLKTLLRKTDPIDVAGTVDRLHIKGTIVMSVTVSTSGEVICAVHVSGHPVLISAALESLRRWKFPPDVASERKEEFCGSVKFEAIGHGLTYQVI